MMVWVFMIMIIVNIREILVEHIWENMWNIYGKYMAMMMMMMMMMIHDFKMCRASSSGFGM